MFGSYKETFEAGSASSNGKNIVAFPVKKY
jgi:hypothetical protein